MIRQSDNFFTLELPELIKVNRLVRGGINLAEFVAWYDSIPMEEQAALLLSLLGGRKVIMRRSCLWGAVVTLTALILTACEQSILYADQQAQQEITIPFTVTASNNIVVKTVINRKDTVKLMLHTAASDVTLTEEAARKSKSIRFNGKMKVEAWGGKEASRFSKGNRVQIGPLQRGNMDIWEDKFSGKDTDGKFGLGFFQKRIVEIDFDHHRIVLHTNLPRKAEKYERLKIENRNDQLLVEGSCLMDGKAYPHQFLIHSGYSGGLLFDDAFAAQTGIDGKIKITDESSLKDSFGHTIKVKKGLLPVFALGHSEILNVPVGFFSGAIGAQKRSVLGSEMLIRFNLIFDMAHNALYLIRRHT